MQRAKRALLASIDDELECAEMRERLRGVGYHSEKRAAVRSPEFRGLPPKVQELFSGTDFETLRSTYDDVDVEHARAVYEASRRAVSG